MKKLSSFILKIIAIITMLLDHIYTYIGGTGIDIPIWFGYLGKIAAPIFFYLIVEGFFHTRNRKKYLFRLASFGVVMVCIDKILGIGNNIFLSLSLAVVLMMFLEKIKDINANKIVMIIGAIVTSSLFLFTEASIYGLVMVIIFYLFRNKKVIMSILYGIFSLSPVLMAIGTGNMYEQLFLFDYQWMMIFALPFILMYNGRLGLKNKFTKWMFYIFYPAHLILIVLLTKIL